MSTQHHLSLFSLKRATRTAVALTLAVILTHYFPPTATFWLPVVAVLLAQSEFAFPVQQGMQRFFWILIIFVLASQIRMWLSDPLYLAAIVLGLSAISAYGYAYTAYRYLGLHFWLLVLITVLLTWLLPISYVQPALLMGIFIGAFVGLGVTLVIFPDQPEEEFSKRIIPLLKDLSAYLAAQVNLILQEPQASHQVQAKRKLVEACWVNKDDTFPVWVFETGFNPSLKAGQYYFAVHLGQMTEILFAMNHFARYDFPQDLLDKFAQPLRACNDHTQELISQIIGMLQGKKQSLSKEDFLQDIEALEQDFRSTLQLSLELLDISRDYIYLTAFIRYLKDLRLQLLQLAATLLHPLDS